MNMLSRGLLLAVLTIPLVAAAAELPSRRFQLPIESGARALQLPVLNAEKALSEDAANTGKGMPLRYAIMHKAAVDVHDDHKQAIGRWTEVGGDRLLWRTRIDAPGAVSIDLALKPFHLPQGAEVWLTDAAGKLLRGPYTAADNPKSREFWTPYVPGDVAYLEVLVPKARRAELDLKIHSVQQAYRQIESGESPFAKSGSCNVDTICAQGDAYRDQINAVGRYSVGGGLCSGQLINNTANNGKRYFTTANHCISTQGDANSVVVYWKYESPTCRTPGSGQSGTPIGTAGNSIVQTGGGLLRATYADADTTLIELNTGVPVSASPYWLGWDRSENAVASGVSIHHPQGHEKRISFENNPLVVSDVAPAGVPGEKHWQIPDWDVGTTEQGSSGSVLLNPQKRLIGVLSGGGAACGNDDPDYYGRLNVAWEGGGSAATRVKDWLDPGNTGTSAIDGRGSCTAPTVAVTVNTLNPIADNPVSMTAQVSGGTGPYTLSWDIDGDGIEDRRVTGVTSSNMQSPRYPERTVALVSVTATDAVGCVGVGGPAFTVQGPQLTAAVNGAATQSCGDGDSNVEPGEIWDVPVRVSNGGQDAMNDGFAVFTGGSATGTSGGGSSTGSNDAFGYRGVSSTASSLCPVQAIDMTAATALSPTRGPHVTDQTSANDEGYVAGLAVGGAQPFKFYDQDISFLLMSTNGYLSTNIADGGDDYTPNCGVDDNGSVDGRMEVLHDDLVVQAGGSLKHRHFSTCPRPANAGSTSQGCTVFEWRNLGQFASGGATGNAVFQAVLYDQSYQIVYQYLTADPSNGAGAIIGLQNPAETIRFNHSCEVANAAPSNSANCFFHPSALPAGIADASVHIVSAANNLGNLAGGANADVSVKAYVDPAAACGSRATVSYLGGVDDFVYSFAPIKVLDVQMPATGNCQVASQCAAQVPGFGALPTSGGLYLNPTRSGNGQNLFNYGTVLSSAWFTGKADRTPAWYLVNGRWNPALTQATAAIQKVTRTAESPFTVAVSEIGTSQFTRGDDDSVYLNTYEIGGKWAADKLVRAFSPTAVPNPNHSGGWYSPAQSGWGLVIDEHIVGGQPSTGIVSYIYDAANEPRWTIGEQAGLSGVMAQSMFLVHCPSCARFDDFGSFALPAGNLTRTYQSQTAGMLESAITFPSPLSGSWSRTSLPIQMLTPPASPTP